jgi:hypothetical protein
MNMYNQIYNIQTFLMIVKYWSTTHRVLVCEKFVCFENADWNKFARMLQKQQVISLCFPKR